MSKPKKIEELTFDTPLEIAAAKILAQRLTELSHHGARAIERSDPEDTHAARVATRRLRAALGLIGGDVVEFREGVSRLGRCLGSVRDIDVLLAWLDALRRRAAPDELAGIDALIAAERSKLPAQEALLREAFMSFEMHTARPLRLRLEPREQDPPAAAHGLRGSLGGKRIRRRLARRLMTVSAGLATLETHGIADVQAVHALRIAGKKARYGLEIVEDVLPVAAKAVAALRELQEVLGDLHDADVRLAFLPRYVVEVVRPEQPGAVCLLRHTLREREEQAHRLETLIKTWQGGRLARRFARRLEYTL